MTDKQELLDRMVDGELSAAEQRELLVQCEQEQWWRDLALTYVESQALRQELRDVWRDPRVETHAGPRSLSHFQHLYPWALAVAVLIALGLGYGLGWTWQPEGGLPAAGPVAGAETPAPRANGGELSSIPLMVADPQSDSIREMRLPIVQASDLQPDWLEQLNALPDELRFELETKGLELRRTRLFAPVELRNGTRVVIPIEYYIERDYQ